jgi:hypothetical protein
MTNTSGLIEYTNIIPNKYLGCTTEDLPIHIHLYKQLGPCSDIFASTETMDKSLYILFGFLDYNGLMYSTQWNFCCGTAMCKRSFNVILCSMKFI